MLKLLLMSGAMDDLNHILNHLRAANRLDSLSVTTHISRDQISGYRLDPVKSLFARLASTASDKGEVLFPRLQNFNFRAVDEKGSGVDDAPTLALPTRNMSESPEAEVNERVAQLLEARVNAGAVPLKLEGPVEFQGFHGRRNFSFKASADLVNPM